MRPSTRLLTSTTEALPSAVVAAVASWTFASGDPSLVETRSAFVAFVTLSVLVVMILASYSYAVCAEKHFPIARVVVDTLLWV
ncbi:hypothetical protein [Halomarina rubra]|uniref:Uncharacterized protein n=1 Tax=Halomarina rubra TaxID=2071873 RepID=A0ABD6ASQ5_9EURY|nr:hypothetical protein [Halomarina rubra]